MPGTYTQIDPGQGAISVNIRGMSGFGRVNTMVDGITQSFTEPLPPEQRRMVQLTIWLAYL
ncbi:Plug domain-containing protein [Escherichia coli]|nr:Plug domain-containing protein [Escherichia coli]MCW7064336.1 Plug domain-containing protein [Escherichia coli]